MTDSPTLADVTADGLCRFDDGTAWPLPAWLVARRSETGDGAWAVSLRETHDGRRRGGVLRAGMPPQLCKRLAQYCWVEMVRAGRAPAEAKADVVARRGEYLALAK